MSRAASYGWIIDVDHLVEPDADVVPREVNSYGSRVGTLGPHNIHPSIKAVLETAADATAASADPLRTVWRWRCLDDDGELYYEGRFIGDEIRMFAPLEDFAQPDAGATTIEYLNAETGAWERL